MQYSLKAMVNFGGTDEEAAIRCPAPGFVLSFNNGDYLHIKQDYTVDWLIGRVVGSDTGLGFLPRYYHLVLQMLQIVWVSSQFLMLRSHGKVKNYACFFC